VDREERAVSQADIANAVALIGEDRADDHVLAPEAHARDLREKAPALSRLLGTGKIETHKNQYEHHDGAAIKAQARFKTAISWANAAVFVTGLLGALIMVVSIVGGLWFPDQMKTSLLGLGLAALATGAFATMWLFRVREGQMLDDWMGERARAETARLGYFATLVGLSDDGAERPPLGLLKLEYFRRYQLDTQIAYYRSAVQRHRRSADRTLVIGSFAAASAAVASGSAGIVASYAAPWAALAAFGVLGTAAAAYAATREAANQDNRNAERYRNTLSSLEILRAKLDDVRAGVLKGSQAVLDDYVAAVHEQLSVEHREWLSGAESTRTAIGKLDETLDKLQDRGANP
jgi:hypothetical protein